MKFSEKIVRLRRIRGITQDELASAVGVSRQAVYKWECGQSYPEVMKLVEIKALFGISIDDLLDESYEIALPDRKKRKRIKRERATAIEREVEEELNATVAEAEEAEGEITVVEVEATPAIEDSVIEPIAEESEEIIEDSSIVAEEIVLEAAEEEAEEVIIDEPEAVSAEEVTTPVEVVAEEVTDEVSKVEKKRGFFSRLFGRR